MCTQNQLSSFQKWRMTKKDQKASQVLHKYIQ